MTDAIRTASAQVPGLGQFELVLVHLDESRLRSVFLNGDKLTMSTSAYGHTVRSFDNDLRRLTEVLVEMGGLALRQVSDATRALIGEARLALVREMPVLAAARLMAIADTRLRRIAIPRAW